VTVNRPVLHVAVWCSIVARYRLPLVVFGVPLPGKRNPYLVLVSERELVDVEVDVEESSSPRLKVDGVNLGWRVETALRSFLDVVCDRLEQPLQATVYLEAGIENLPPTSIYAVLSLELVKSVSEAGGYSLEPLELLEATKSVDVDAGVDFDYVWACRAALMRGRATIFREGEELLDANVPSIELELVGEEEVGLEMGGVLGETLYSLLTKLAGFAVVELVNRLRSGEGWESVWSIGARVENAIYYLYYGLNPPAGEDCKWTPGFQSGYGVCVKGAGLGESVRFV